MIERLQRALEHIEELSPDAQVDLATQIEEQAASPISEQPSLPTEPPLPERIHVALAAIGSARDLLDDDEFAALDRIRHESPPSPPIDLDDL